MKIVELEKESPKTQALLKALYILNTPSVNVQESINEKDKMYGF